MTQEDNSTPGPADLKRAIDISNACVIAAGATGNARVPLYFAKPDLLLLSGALRCFVLTWGDLAQRKQIAEFLSGTPAEKAARIATIIELEEMRKEVPQ